MAELSIGGRVREIKYAVISGSSANNTLISAVASRKLRVMSLFMQGTVGTNATYTFQSNAGGTNLSGAIPGAVTISLPYNEGGWFETVAGQLLNLAIGGTPGSATGSLSYIEVV